MKIGLSFPQEIWKSEKAKALLKYLTLNRNKGYISKDLLLELIWPDQDPDVTSNRFHVALSTIRKTLEPDLPRGKPSSYLLRKGNSYRLEIGSDGSIDIDLASYWKHMFGCLDCTASRNLRSTSDTLSSLRNFSLTYANYLTYLGKPTPGNIGENSAKVSPAVDSRGKSSG